MSKSKPKIAIISASLGGFDPNIEHADQSLAHDYYLYTDDNFPPRFNAMTPRLQAKIPKCFGWQMVPDYDYYFWIDGNLTLTNPDSLKYVYDNCQDYDIVAFQHPRRNTAYWEYRYVWRGMHSRKTSDYITNRYTGELLDEQIAVIKDDKDYVDDLLVNGGMFMYRNTPEIHRMLKEWWYHMSRYLIMDQCSFPYILKKSGVRMNVRPDNIMDSPYVAHRGHTRH